MHAKTFAAAVLTLSLAGAGFLTATAVAAPREDAPHAMSWLQGDWVGEGFGGVVEEAWLAPRDGVMVGVFRHHAGGKPNFYELMTITERAGELTMGLKHFHADLRGWEAKDESLVWPASEVGERTVRFGPVLYELAKDGRLHVWVEVDENEPQELVFERAKG